MGIDEISEVGMLGVLIILDERENTWIVRMRSFPRN